MFDRRLPAVVPMDYRVLARTDGSAQAAGRGSGLNVKPREEEEESDNPRGQDRRGPAGKGGKDRRQPQRGAQPEEREKPKTPYMHMTYHPTERRLDTAIFRSLFASSTRQARQFVVHGFVRVNGKKVC